MSDDAVIPAPAEPYAPLEAPRVALARARAAFDADRYPSLEVRLQRLDQLARAIVARKEDLAAAVSRDFGNRSRHETLLAEVMVTVSSIRYLASNLRDWMAPQPRHVSWTFRPGRASVTYQPLGVVGVIAPWNYPLQLALVPLATALAAGNRVVLKPSEITPESSATLGALLGDLFPDDLVSVVQGDAAVGVAFSQQPWDHLVFTGSTRVGRAVMRAAAEHLTPVTLELGGKSPVIVAPGFDLARAAERVAFGKLINAGQTCIAPDYALVPRGQEEAFAAALGVQIARLYPTLAKNPDYTSIINGHHHARLQHLLADARDRGAEVRTINPASETFEDRRMPPHLILRPSDEMAVLQEEIFGPILPIIGVTDVDAAMAYVNARPRPLALYHFDRDERRVQQVLRGTHAGGVCVNDTLMHIGQDDLPFGGVGPSGLGRYHGPEGFQSLSHPKAVFRQARWNAGQLVNPPYGKAVERLLDLLIGRA
jgi:coniferyl-aldehyde dehydrogenase